MDTIGDESVINLDDEINFVDGQAVGDDKIELVDGQAVGHDNVSSERLDNQDENRAVVDNQDENRAVVNNQDESRAGIDERLKSIAQLTTDEIWGLEFASESEACEFYQTYARCHGFVMRKDEIHRDFNGQIVMRQLVCNRQGLRDKKHFTKANRKRDPKPITRTNCLARFRVHLDFKTSKWKVVAFEESHNHELNPAVYVHLHPTYRVMTNADKTQVESLNLNGLRTSHIMGFMLGQKDGYDGLGFCKRDLYNHLDMSRLVMVEEGDAFATLSYLQGKADNDPMLYAKFTTTEDGKLQHLFWSDGCSRIDFQCFGDVLAFNSTFTKNKYNQQLMIFSGCNHHGSTTIFGCALIADEKVETYKWVLETFLEAMFNKHPKSVVTNGDGDIRLAAQIVFPYASHRLCSWHLENNVKENIKNEKFLEDFKTAIYSDFNEVQFEEFWRNMIVKHGVFDNMWIKDIYDIRGMWAAAYLRGKFFAGIKTTSQCESINSFLKRFVEKKNSLVDFMSNFERALKEYRHDELIEDFKSMYSEPVMTTSLYEIEFEASKIFTRKIFKEVKKEIEGVGALNVIEQSESGNKLKFKMNIFRSPSSEYNVLYDKNECEFMCDCGLFQSRGIPCSHIFCAMKYQHMSSIPSSLVCKRWTKDAKKDYISIIASNQRDDSQKITTLRFGVLSTACNKLCHLGARNFDDFNYVRDEIFKLTAKLEEKLDLSSDQSTMDLTVVKTKGNHSKRKYGKRRKSFKSKRTGQIIQKSSHPAIMDDGVNNLSSCSESDEDTREVDNDDLSSDDKISMQADSIQRPSSNDKAVEIKGTCSSIRKHEKKQQLQEHVVQNTHSNSAPINMPSSFHPPTQGMQVFPPYAGGPIYPQMMYPPNPSLGFYPQYFGGFQNIPGANTSNRIPLPRLKK